MESKLNRSEPCRYIISGRYCGRLHYCDSFGDVEI